MLAAYARLPFPLKKLAELLLLFISTEVVADEVRYHRANDGHEDGMEKIANGEIRPYGA